MDTNAVASMIEEGISLEHSGQIGAAMECARQALEMAQSTCDSNSIANAMIFLGDLHYRLGQFEVGKTLGKQALTLAGRYVPARVDALNLLGNCSMEIGMLDETEQYYRDAADLSRQIGYESGLISALHNLGACVYALRGQFDMAFAAEEEAFRIARNINSPLKPSILISMCFDSLLTGQYQRARDLLGEIQPIVSGNYRLTGYYIWLNAYLSQLVGDLAAAFEHYKQLRPYAESTGDIGLNVFLRIGMSGCHQISNNASAAFDWANDAVTWVSRTSTRRFLGRVLTERGRSAWLKGDLEAAENDLRQAIDDLQARQQVYDLARALLLLAALLHQQSNSAAELAYREAITLVTKGNFPYLLERERSLILPLIAYYRNSTDASLKAINARLLESLAGTPPQPLRIFTLGHFEVYRQGIKIPDKAWRHCAGELFRLLLISPGKSLSRDQVIDALWPEKPLSSGILFFHQATSSLRRALEPDLPDKFPSHYLLVEERRVWLCLPSGSQVDFECFETLISKLEWDAALKLFQGEPFAKDRYQDWAQWKREQLIQQSRRARLALATQSLESGDAGQALTYCQLVWSEEPWHEEAVLLGMRAYVKLSNRPAALRLYKDLERYLHEEFEIEPMPEIKALYLSIVKTL